jgi:tetratricopeptide (TPR) repeat protein
MLKALIVSLATFFAIVVYFKINNYHGMGFGALYDRFVWCESALRMAREKPFFGFGPGCFGNLYLSYKVLPANNTAYLHNIAIQLLIESGLAGFIVFLWLFLKACYLKLNSSCELDKIAVVSLLCYTASELSGFTYNLLAFKIIFFITLLSSCGDSQALKREKPLYSKTIALLASFLVLIWPSLIFSATLLKNSGLYYIDNKNPHAAISMFERSIALDPLPSDVYSNMASALFSEYAGSGDKGYLSRSIAAQTEAAKRSPANAARYSDLAWLYFTDSRHEEAKEFIKKAFLLDRFNKKYADSLRLMNKNENTIQN